MAKRSMSETKKDEQFCHEEEEEEEEEITEEEEEEELEGEVSRKRILIRFSGESTRSVSSQTTPCCQVDGCDVDLRTAKIYHRRHKVCERHAKEAVVSVCGVDQRYCQQCSRFHIISEFDDTKRSCRMRLAGHNERRRKNHPDIQAEEDESWEPAVPP